MTDWWMALPILLMWTAMGFFGMELAKDINEKEQHRMCCVCDQP